MSAGGDSLFDPPGATGTNAPRGTDAPSEPAPDAPEGNRLLVAGESFEDLIFAGLERLPRSGEEIRAPAFERTVGGGAVISAAWARTAGLSVRILSRFPPRFPQVLKAEALTYRDLRRAGAPHAVTAALSYFEDRSFVTYAAPNMEIESQIYGLLPSELAPEAGPAIGAVLFALSPTSPQPWAELRQRAEAAGLEVPPIFWDFGYDPDLPDRPGFEALLQAADGVFVNELEAGRYGGRKGALRRAADAGTLVIEKLGRRGAEALGRSGTRVPAPIPLRVRDTTGAGDAFNAGFLASRLAGGTLAEQLAAGNALGARCVQRLGGLPPRPWGRPATSAEAGEPAPGLVGAVQVAGTIGKGGGARDSGGGGGEGSGDAAEDSSAGASGEEPASDFEGGSASASGPDSASGSGDDSTADSGEGSAPASGPDSTADSGGDSGDAGNESSTADSEDGSARAPGPDSAPDSGDGSAPGSGDGQ